MSEIHFHALCSAVEHDKTDKVIAILHSHSHQLDLARHNADGFTPLELAFMTANEEALEALLEHGAKEGNTIKDNNPVAVSAHLLSLVQEAKKQVDKFGQLRKASQAAQLTHAQLKECEKQQTLWMKRMNTIKRLRTGFEAAGCPHAPQEVLAVATGPSALRVRLRPPDAHHSRGLFTKWRVQWSHGDAFVNVEGEKMVTGGVNELECEVDGLEEGRRYFVRAAFGNPKGFGPFSAATPKSVVPSSWRSVEDRVPRIQNQLDVCVDAYADMVRSSGIDEEYEPHRVVKRKGLRHLFSSSSSAPKFARSLHPNRVYLACVIFHEDKVLMTNEESLPVMEVTEEFPTTGIMSEHAWFAKMAFAWRDVERLKHEAAKMSGSAYKFRASLLSAAMNMQHGLGISDLGAAFHRPLVHSDGSAIFSLVSHLRSPKSLVSLSLKWVPLSKAQRRSSLDGSGEVSPLDALRHSLREQILFSQVCEIRLSRGLYLCYLQCTSTVDSMRVVVSSTSPSVLPYIKVRDTAHVTCDEWSWLGRLGRLSSQGSSMAVPSPTTNFLAGEGEEGSDIVGANNALKMLKPTEAQYSFGLCLQSGLCRLFDYLEIPEKDRQLHRMYSHEILELSSEVSLILVLPPAETICAVASDASDLQPSFNLRRNDLLTLPLQIFETVHLNTYHPDLLTAYCRAVLLLDIDLVVAKQAVREAFSAQETESAQQRLAMLTGHQATLEENWRPIRWLLEVLPTARNKTVHCGLRFDHLNEWYNNQTVMPDDTKYVPSPEKPPRTDDVDYFRRQEETLSQINASHPMREDNASTHEMMGRPSSASKLQRTPTTRSDPLEFNLNDKENEVRNYPKMAFVPPSGGVQQLSSSHQSQQSGGGSGQQFSTTIVAGGAGSAPQSHVQVQQQGQPQQQQQPPPVSYSSLTYSQNSTNSSLSSGEVLQPKQQQQQQQPYYENCPPSQQQQHQQHHRHQRKQSTSLERPIFKQSYDPRVAQSGRFSNIPGGGGSDQETSTATAASSSDARNLLRQQQISRSLSPEPNILQVFAAYETGLASGTSVKLNVTHNTSAREVIDLVIKQLNMAVILKGRDGPVYENERLRHFCLVAVIGNRERCLRDDFKPLNLQNPWKKGKLFVRMKNDLLAAIEHISRHSTML